MKKLGILAILCAMLSVTSFMNNAEAAVIIVKPEPPEMTLVPPDLHQTQPNFNPLDE